jgi:hypothetical protein
MSGTKGQEPVATRMVPTVNCGAVGERHLVGAGDGGALVVEVDLVVLEDAAVDGLDPVDLGQHVVAQGRPVEVALGDVPAEAAGVGEILGEVGARRRASSWARSRG